MKTIAITAFSSTWIQLKVPSKKVMKKFISPVIALASLTSFFVVISTASATLSDGLFAYYKFEGNADDSSGNGNDGTVFDATFVPSMKGTGLEFTGSNSSYVDVPHSAELSPPDAVTMSAWAKVLSYPTSYSALIYKAGETPTTSGFRDRVYTLWVTSSRGVHLTSTPEGGTTQIFCNSPGSRYALNRFVHFAGVINTVSHKMAIYINGSKVAECPYTGDSLRGGNFPLRIGGPFKTLGDQSGLDGVLDEVRIYNRALSATEIRTLFNQGKPVGGSVTGVNPRRVICRNLTTGQTITIQLNSASWDCETAGLGVNAGDRIQQTVTGRAD